MLCHALALTINTDFDSVLQAKLGNLGSFFEVVE